MTTRLEHPTDPPSPSSSPAGGSQKYSAIFTDMKLKVHKRENFFGADFVFVSKLLLPMYKCVFFRKKSFGI